MIDIEAIKQAALAAAKGEKSPHPIQARFLLEATPSAVLELFAKLSVAEAASKFWESHANDLATQDNKLIAEMTQQAIEAENVITDLTAKLEAIESNQILGASASQFKEMEARLEAAELDATVGNWLCNYMAGQRVDLDDYLVGACHDDDPVKFKAAVLAAMKENK